MGRHLRDNFTSTVIDRIAKRSAQNCSLCQRPTSGPHSDQSKATIIGVAAHIHAAAPGGPRYLPNMTQKERSGIGNAIWLCQNCAKLVDSDVEKYSAPKLRALKKVHEARVEKNLLTFESEDSLSDIAEHLERRREFRKKYSEQFVVLHLSMLVKDSLPDPIGWWTFGEMYRSDLNPCDQPGSLPPFIDAGKFADEMPNRPLDGDVNAVSWVATQSAGFRKSIEGTWKSRWSRFNQPYRLNGIADITVFENWVEIQYEDDSSSYIIMAYLSKEDDNYSHKLGINRLIGRYLNCLHPEDSLPWVGLIANNRRIDGFWPQGRWDFRR